jgi:ATP-binding protein involved in chromosome partitioning
VIDDDDEVSAGGELVEMVPGDVRVKLEVLGYLARRDAVTIAGEKVDPAAGGVPEGGRDGSDCGGETIPVRHDRLPLMHLAHPRYRTGAAVDAGEGGRQTRNERPVSIFRPGGGTTDRPGDGVVDAVESTVDPRLFHPIGQLGMVRSVDERRRATVVVLAVPSGGHPDERALIEAVTTSVREAGAAEAEVQLVSMTSEEELELQARLHELGHVGGSSLGQEPGPGATRDGRHGAEGPAARPNPFAAKGSPTRVIAIGSGKGGVGKSSVTVNLAVSLARLGHSVALLDADVYGFSVPSMLGLDEAPSLVGDLLLPPVAWGVRCISMGFFVPEDQAVIWRGPMLHKALEQFLVDVHWGQPEFLLIDLPPGTGDVALSIAQFVPSAELIVVTTPQPAAERVAQRAAVLARQLRLPLRGVVENMSWFTGLDGHRYELFGAGGGAALAESLGVGLLAQIPLLPALRAGGDDGKPIAAVDPDNDVARAFHELAAKMVALGPSRVYRSELSVR